MKIGRFCVSSHCMNQETLWRIIHQEVNVMGCQYIMDKDAYEFVGVHNDFNEHKLPEVGGLWETPQYTLNVTQDPGALKWKFQMLTKETPNVDKEA
jgi:hypothetical protein